MCHQTTRSVGDFDRHRRDGWCLDLGALGLVEQGGVWASPEGHAWADHLRERMADLNGRAA